jgi:hypothetical protein
MNYILNIYGRPDQYLLTFSYWGRRSLEREAVRKGEEDRPL